MTKNDDINLDLDSNNDDNDDDEMKEDEFDLSNFNFDDADLDLNFDDEELEDEEELKNIEEKKKNKEQEDPFKNFSNEFSKDDIDNNDVDSDSNDDLDNLFNDDTQVFEDDLLNNDNAEQQTSDIIKMNENIENINIFMKHMEQRGYQLESSRFLTKKFAEASNKQEIYNIHITINDEVLTAITGYDVNNKVVTIPESILKVVQNDINKALKQII